MLSTCTFRNPCPGEGVKCIFYNILINMCKATLVHTHTCSSSIVEVDKKKS